MITATFDKSAEDFEKRATAFQGTLEEGVKEANEAFRDRFVEQELSGRKPNDMGLNIQTGTLHGDVQAALEETEEGEGEILRPTVFTTIADYVAFHMDPDSTTHKMRIDPEGDFLDWGMEGFYGALVDAGEMITR